MTFTETTTTSPQAPARKDKTQCPPPKFTGEYMVPGSSPERIEADHFARYQYAAHLSKGRSILDIACGTGYAGPLLLEAGAASYEGVDINPDLIAYCRSAYREVSGLCYNVGDVCCYESGKRYDLITCFETIEHVEDYNKVLATLHRLCKDGGTLLISSPNRPIASPGNASLSDKPLNTHHTQEFTPQELLELICSHGFHADESNVLGQRQRRLYRPRIAKKIARKLLGNPDANASPAVAPIRTGLAPRYFLIQAPKLT